MSENCPNHSSHDKRIEKLEGKYEFLEMRISKAEARQDVSDEKFVQIFKKLDEIIEILKVNQSRLPNLTWGVAGTISGGVMVGVIMWILKG
jgi:hypothetical protein